MSELPRKNGWTLADHAGDTTPDRTHRTAPGIVADMVDDQTLPGWFAGDEVYGRSRELRDYIPAQGVGHVLRAGCDFRVEMTPGTRERVDTHLTGRKQRKR